MFRVLRSIVAILRDGWENADLLGTGRPILQCSQTICKAPPMEPAVSKRRQPLEFLFFGVRVAHYLLLLQDEVPDTTGGLTRQRTPLVYPQHVWIVQVPQSPTVVSLEGRR